MLASDNSCYTEQYKSDPQSVSLYCPIKPGPRTMAAIGRLRITVVSYDLDIAI